MPAGVTDRSLIKHAQSLLSEPRVAVVPLTQQLTATLRTASTALQGQLQCWADRAPPADYTGFQLSPQKRRAEFRIGHANLGRMGALQQMPVEVSAAACVFKRSAQLKASSFYMSSQTSVLSKPQGAHGRLRLTCIPQVVHAYDALARAFLAQLALKLMMPYSLFEPILDAHPGTASASSLEAIEYLESAEMPATQHQAAGGCESHDDQGLLTCICSNSTQGLQICTAVFDRCCQGKLCCARGIGVVSLRGNVLLL